MTRTLNNVARPKRSPLKRWRHPQQNGNASTDRHYADERVESKRIQHFMRCELQRPLKDQESRGHVFAKDLTHPWDKTQAKKGRVNIRCVFCGETDKLTRLTPKPHDGVLVENVLENDFVKQEAKARDVDVTFFDVGQEVEN